MIKNKLKELLTELKKSSDNISLRLSKDDCKIFHLRAELIAIYSDIDEAFKSMHQSIITKIKKYVCKDWIVLDVIIKHSITIFKC